MGAGEPQHPALHLPRQRRRQWIVVVEHRRVLCRLVLKDTHFDSGVFFHGAMAVQMILGNVEQCRGPGMEIHDGLQLEAADLGNKHIVLPAVHRRRRVGIADVPHHMRDLARIFEDFTQQTDGSGLAVGTRHRHHFACRQLVGQLQLANDRQPHLPRLYDKGRSIRHHGADDHALRFVQHLHGRASQPPDAMQFL